MDDMDREIQPPLVTDVPEPSGPVAPPVKAPETPVPKEAPPLVPNLPPQQS